MNVHIPGWLSGTIVAAVAVGAVYFLGASTTPPEQKSLYKDAPAITGTLIDGSSFHLSDYKGKVVLLNFWGTWCPPCRAEIPDLIALQKKYGKKDFTIIGIAQNRDQTSDEDYRLMLKYFTAKAGINYPNISLPPGVGSAYNIEAFPSTFLIDKEGKIVYATVGMITPETVSQEIEKRL